MRTLVVLCAGSRQINNKPVIINRHPEGSLLAEKAIQGVFPQNYDRIVFTIMKEMESLYNAGTIIQNELGERYPVEIVELENPTNGPTSTVYETIRKANIMGEFAVRDSLNAISLVEDMRGNFIGGLDLTKYQEDVFHVRSKSFIVTNEQHQVLDVVEKKFRSDIISVGIYGFKRVEDYILAYNKLNDPNYPIGKLYVSNIISYLIGYKERVFHFVETLSHEDWGKNETWHALQKNYGLCFVDLDNLFGDELFITSDTILDEICKWRTPKQSFIFYTSRMELDCLKIKNDLQKSGIKCLSVISNCPITEENYLVKTSSQLETALLEAY